MPRAPAGRHQPKLGRKRPASTLVGLALIVSVIGPCAMVIYLARRLARGRQTRDADGRFHAPA